MPPTQKILTLPNGDTIELYFIGTLAEALGRTPNAVRKWEISGVIPDTCFKDEYGRRLYTQEQIDAIVRCAERARIAQGSPIMSTSFSKWVHEEMAALREKYAQALKEEQK